MRRREPVASTEVMRVLLVEDDEDSYLITREMLASHHQARFKLDWCAGYEQALSEIRARRHDVYLIEDRIGARAGLDLVREGFSARPTAPVIMLAGEGNYETDLEATTLGVADYLVKRELQPASLERSIRYAIFHQQVIRDLALSEERHALAVAAAQDGIWDWDLTRDRIYFSPRWHAILGQPERGEEDDPGAWFDLVHHDDVRGLRAAIDAHLAGQTPSLQSEHRMRNARGGWCWVLARGLAIRDSDGEATRLAGSLSDITDRRSVERQLHHDALHDGLTGLPNRVLFMDRVDQVMQRATRDPSAGCAVLFLDVDRFKLVNDSLSHAIGDNLLVVLAGRVAGLMRPGDTVARIGGDEFTILLNDVLSAEAATAVVDRVQDSLSKPFSIDGHELLVTASIGIALSGPRMTSGDVLRNADIAMYDAKRRGRARAAVFDQGMQQRVVDRLAREKDLREAIEQSLLPIYFQPIVDLSTGRIRALEALVRWPHQWPYVAPLDFIPIAEETGVIAALGLHVLRTALETLARWRAAGLIASDVCVSVNVSSRQLDDPELPGQLRAAIAAAGLTSDALRLEITESTLMQDPERIQTIVSEVCASGVALHLDDFGTGYSSLPALHRFPVDALKIDRGFVASMNGKPDSGNTIVRSIVALAHSLGLVVIAEGIETAQQLQRLRTLGCEYGQGYLFSQPQSPEDTETLLVGWSSSWAATLGDRAPSG